MGVTQFPACSEVNGKAVLPIATHLPAFYHHRKVGGALFTVSQSFTEEHPQTTDKVTQQKAPLLTRMTRAFATLTDALFHPLTLFLALLGLVLGAFILPPEGFGPSTCSMLASTGIPCPSCGLTRSVTCVFQGEWTAAWQYNPFGFVFAVLFLLLGPLMLLPKRWRNPLRERIRRFDGIIAFVLLIFLAGLLIFGVVRAAMVQMNYSSVSWWRTDSLPPAFQDSHFHAGDSHGEISARPGETTIE